MRLTVVFLLSLCLLASPAIADWGLDLSTRFYQIENTTTPPLFKLRSEFRPAEDIKLGLTFLNQNQSQVNLDNSILGTDFSSPFLLRANIIFKDAWSYRGMFRGRASMFAIKNLEMGPLWAELSSYSVNQDWQDIYGDYPFADEGAEHRLKPNLLTFKIKSRLFLPYGFSIKGKMDDLRTLGGSLNLNASQGELLFSQNDSLTAGLAYESKIIPAATYEIRGRKLEFTPSEGISVLALLEDTRPNTTREAETYDFYSEVNMQLEQFYLKAGVRRSWTFFTAAEEVWGYQTKFQIFPKTQLNFSGRSVPGEVSKLSLGLSYKVTDFAELMFTWGYSPLITYDNDYEKPWSWMTENPDYSDKVISLGAKISL